MRPGSFALSSRLKAPWTLQLTSSEQDYLDTPVKALAAPRYAQLLALLGTTSRLFWQPTRMLRLLLVARVHLPSHVHCGHRARAHLYRIEEPCIWGGKIGGPKLFLKFSTDDLRPAFVFACRAVAANRSFRDRFA